MSEKKAAITLLKQVRELLADPEKWTTNAAARNKRGLECDTLSADACQFCLVGAIGHFARIDNAHIGMEAWELLSKHAGFQGSPVRVNDDEGYAAVLALLDTTIEKEGSNDGTGV